MALNFILPIMQTVMSVFQARQQQRAAQQAAQQQLNQQSKEQWAAYEKAEKERKKQLKKALATRRARFSGRGLSATDGSAGAVTQGLQSRYAEDRHEDYTNRQEGLDDTRNSLTDGLLDQARKTRRDQYQKIGQLALNGSGGNNLLP